MPIELGIVLLVILSIDAAIAIFAHRHGRSAPMFFALSLIFSPLIALVIMAFTKPSQPVPFEPQVATGFLGEPGTAPSSLWSTPARSRGWPLVVLIVAAVIVAGLVLVVGQGGSSIPGLTSVTASTEPLVDGLPPPGQVWFGRSYDDETFEVRDRIATGKVDQLFVLVGALPTVIDMSTARLQISLNGARQLDDPLGLTGDGDLYALEYTPPLRGIYRFDVTVDGDILAGGAIKVD